MSSSRLTQLLAFYKDDPTDPFNIYALAMEYQNVDSLKAKDYLELLLKDHEEYIPTYYHAAKLYQSLGDREKAISTYEKGLIMAKNKQDMKAVRELKSAYDELMFE